MSGRFETPEEIAACRPVAADIASLRLRPRWERHGVSVGQHLDTAQTVDRREAGLRQVHAFCRQGQKKLTLHQQSRAYRLLRSGDQPMLILLAGCQ